MDFFFQSVRSAVANIFDILHTKSLSKICSWLTYCLIPSCISFVLRFEDNLSSLKLTQWSSNVTKHLVCNLSFEKPTGVGWSRNLSNCIVTYAIMLMYSFLMNFNNPTRCRTTSASYSKFTRNLSSTIVPQAMKRSGLRFEFLHNFQRKKEKFEIILGTVNFIFGEITSRWRKLKR